MERRELLKMIAVLTGGIMIGGDALLTGCVHKEGEQKSRTSFSEEEKAFLDEVAETILPATKTPGAKAAKVGSFMALMVDDCYELNDQKIFHEGIGLLDNACKKMHGSGFLKVSPEQRQQLLQALDKEVRKGVQHPYFNMMKQLTLLGYFSSEIGCTQALRYMPVPGKYQGSVPYKKGDKSWA